MSQKLCDQIDVNILIVKWSEIVYNLLVVVGLVAFESDDCDSGSKVLEGRCGPIEI
jgi:hypothetical protein